MWVGFDDYSELGLEGAHSALPIWTEFMMDAAHYKQYGDAKPFPPPPGVVKVESIRTQAIWQGRFVRRVWRRTLSMGLSPNRNARPKRLWLLRRPRMVDSHSERCR